MTTSVLCLLAIMTTCQSGVSGHHFLTLVHPLVVRIAGCVGFLTMHHRCALMLKSHRSLFFVVCGSDPSPPTISGSRSPALFLVEVGAATNVVLTSALRFKIRFLAVSVATGIPWHDASERRSSVPGEERDEARRIDGYMRRQL